MGSAQNDQLLRSQDLMIFVWTTMMMTMTMIRPITLPLMHACGTIKLIYLVWCCAILSITLGLLYLCVCAFCVCECVGIGWVCECVSVCVCVCVWASVCVIMSRVTSVGRTLYTSWYSIHPSIPNLSHQLKIDSPQSQLAAATASTNFFSSPPL